jgi:uncharacterized protein YndB with AHSA1/START domain
MRPTMRAVVIGMLLAVPAGVLPVGASRAEVVDVQASGFAVKRTLAIAAPPAKVYAALVQIGQWWDPTHSYSGASTNMTLEAKAGGCWCEALPKSKGQVAHMRVVFVDPGSLLRFEGSLGPLQETGASGHMTWSVAAKDGGSVVTWSYDVGGYFNGGFKQIAPAVDGVFAGQMGRLKAYVETGKPG